MAPRARIQFTADDFTAGELSKVCATTGLSVKDAVQEAIRFYAWAKAEEAKGGMLMLRTGDGHSTMKVRISGA